ncbi:hypothetical protein Y032_0272g915 [Ancylostoma ceylanicum]|uniref:Uncharacterized protein n=1 Tax=Ancylostoma ceylanicum TaxID=53326 RepID=A0A016S8M0_9BILA|nr:hypothetical protein Y032_0272g915 [Ancylostoma ceylanicum]
MFVLINVYVCTLLNDFPLFSDLQSVYSVIITKFYVGIAFFFGSKSTNASVTTSTPSNISQHRSSCKPHKPNRIAHSRIA